MKLGDQDKQWAPHKVCKNCTDTLCFWTQGKAKAVRFGVPMVWRSPKNYHDDCCFCMVNMLGRNRYKKNLWYYPDLESARWSVPHCEEVPIPVFSFLPKLVLNDDLLAETGEANSDESNYSSSMSDTTAEWQSKVKPFSQIQLNDLAKDLALSKEASEVLASCLSEHGILDSKTKITFYCHRDEALSDYFTKDVNFVFCINVKGLLTAMGVPNTNRVSGVCL